MERVQINVCSEEELAVVPYVGKKTLAIILRRREETQGQLTPAMLDDLPTLRKIDLHAFLNFTPAYRILKNASGLDETKSGVLKDPVNVNPFSTGTGRTLYKVYGGFRISYGTG